MGIQSQKTAAASAICTIVAILLPALAGAQTILRGVLYDDSTGAPLHGGAVVLVDPGSDAPVYHTKADSNGVFRVNITRAGTYQIAAIHEGYQSILSAPVPFAEGDRLTVKIPVSMSGNPIHHIGVTEHVTALRSNASTQQSDVAKERRALLARHHSSGMGIVYDHERLLSMQAQTVGDVLQMTPGVGVGDASGITGSAVRMRQNDFQFGMSGNSSTGSVCHVGWYLDGQRYDRGAADVGASDGLMQMSLNNVEAIEVYRGISEVPGEYAAPDLRCGVIAVWTVRQN
jgi:hypothetical protein